jgi:hypothetical protein
MPTFTFTPGGNPFADIYRQRFHNTQQRIVRNVTGEYKTCTVSLKYAEKFIGKFCKIIGMPRPSELVKVKEFDNKQILAYLKDGTVVDFCLLIGQNGNYLDTEYRG